MATQLPKEWLQWLYKVLQPEYKNPQFTYQDVAITLQSFPLLKVRTKVHTNEVGVQELLLSLYGTIPSTYNNAIYRIPIEIWVPKVYPEMPPIIYVTPASDMMIQPGNFVDNNGRFYNPYLSYWKPNDPASNLIKLCNLLSDCFSKELPVFARPQRQMPSQTALQMLPVSTKTASLPLYTSSKFHSPPPLPAKPQRQTSASKNQSNAQLLSELQPKSPPPLPPLPEKRRSHPSPVNNLATANVEPIDLMDSIATNDTGAAEHIRQSVTAALIQESKQEIEPFFIAQDTKLNQINQSISQFESIVQYEKNILNNYLNDISVNENILKQKISETQTVLHQAETFQEPQVDDIVCAETVVYNQLYGLVADIKAIDDTIYSLAQLHDKGRVSLDLFMKHSRALAREQFEKKALIKKIVDAK